MIKNERQYKITRSQLKKFEETLELLSKEDTSELHPLFAKAQLDSINSQIETFKREITEYEKIKAGQINCFSIDISNFSEGIINSRIARGLNHRDFGKILGVTEQQIQKYESENYQSTSLSRIQEIIDILEINVKTIFNLAKNNSCVNSNNFLHPNDVNVDIVNEVYRKRKTTVKMCA